MVGGLYFIVLCVIFGWCYGVIKITLMGFCRGFILVQSKEIEMEQMNEQNRTSLPQGTTID